VSSHALADGLELGSELGISNGLALGMKLGPTDGIVLGMRLGLLVGLSVIGLLKVRVYLLLTAYSLFIKM
jgi:hypothetical protein